ncbi:MAG TPA: hypothetical protein VF796_27770 [Humisphaera sp.]
MFAGPNGSGKTTVKLGLNRPPEWFGTYINPDDIERTMRETGSLPLSPFGLTTDADEVRRFFAASTFLRQRQPDFDAAAVDVVADAVTLRGVAVTSYHASVLADFLRRTAVASARSFSFETVMSSRDKVDLLRDCRARGFRTYLYYVATEDPAINVERVRLRVASGGHDVPEDRVVARYRRSLDLLPEAIRHADRAYLFDTSGREAWYFAEGTGGNHIELKSDEMPNWFRPVWNGI